MKLIVCGSCKKGVSPSDKCCTHCGVEQTITISCAKCGVYNSPTAKICFHCENNLIAVHETGDLRALSLSNVRALKVVFAAIIIVWIISKILDYVPLGDFTEEMVCRAGISVLSHTILAVIDVETLSNGIVSVSNNNWKYECDIQGGRIKWAFGGGRISHEQDAQITYKVNGSTLSIVVHHAASSPSKESFNYSQLIMHR
jgi:hypothetical protein